MLKDVTSNLSQQELAAKRFEIVTTKLFIDRDDFQIIIGRRRFISNKIFNEIHNQITTEVEAKGMIFPYENLLPLKLTLEHLKVLGITKDDIVKNYQMIANTSQQANA